MSDPQTALGGQTASGLVELSEATPRGMISLRGDLNDATLKSSVEKLTGTEFPGIGQVSAGQQSAACWMSPDELMIFVSHQERYEALTALRDTLTNQHVLIEDMSDARAIICLKGDLCRDVLGKLTPADLRASILPPGRLRRTRLGQVPAAFWFRDETKAEVLCFRSVAKYVFDLLEMASSGPPLR